MKPRAFERSPTMLRRATSFSGRPKADVLIVPVWREKKKVSLAAPIGKLASSLRHPIKSDEFTGKIGDILHLFPTGQKEKRLLLLGLGDSKNITIEELRRAYAGAIRSLSSKAISKINVCIPESKHLSEDEVLRGIAEGMLLSDYHFEEYVGEKKKKARLNAIALIGASKEAVKRLEHTRGVVRGVYLTKDLVNRNADEVNPQYLVNVALTLEDQFSTIQTTIFDKKRLEEEGMGLLLAVGRGSHQDPAMIISHYKGDPKSKDHTVIVGKGVTYDTGGLDLKTSMLTMKCDMGGAGTCLGLLLAAASTKLKANFTIVIPTTENTIGTRSYKPGDVYKSYSGKTVEIGNTDAEGRLILADALSYACKKLKPTRLIDFATLTGAMVVSLGHEVTGLMSNDDKLADQLIAAGTETHERVWRLPLIEEYTRKLKSDIADLKNVSGREAGSIKAALFLREFISDVPWAHLDIAGSSFLPEGRDYLPKYATGFGVRLMMQFFEDRVTL